MPHGSLEIIVKCCRNLKDKDLFGKMDPYITIAVDSDVKKTTVKYGKGKNPVFNEKFLFDIGDSAQTVTFNAYDDDVGKDDHIGTTNVPVSEISKTGSFDKTLELKSQNGKYAGDLQILAYFTPRMNQGLQKAPPSAAAYPGQIPQAYAPQFQGYPPTGSAYPGQFQGYPGPGQAYPVPGQAYPMPGQAYPMPGQAYPAPGQAYPMQAYPGGPPPQQQPGQAYPAPPSQPGWPNNQQAYAQPGYPPQGYPPGAPFFPGSQR